MSENKMCDLKQATRFTVTTIVDNYTDILLLDEKENRFVKRFPRLGKDGKRTMPLLAEHGLSFLLEVEGEGTKHTVMMDFGLSNISVMHNIRAMDIDLAEVETFLISHGHHDHLGSIREVLASTPQPRDVVVHPDAFLEERLYLFPDGRTTPIPSLKREMIDSRFPVVEITAPRLLADGLMATVTEIPRVTDFEKGMRAAHYRKDGVFFKDDIRDDQGVVVHIKGKGLVIVTGCGHSGIINTILHAREITGVQEVFAVIGGFHLSGVFYEPVVERTIEEMKKFSPSLIAPTHCTGWKTQVAFSRAFPEAFVLNAVGTKLVLE